MFAGCLQIMWAHWQLIRVDGVGYLQLIRAQNTDVCRSYGLCLQAVTSIDHFIPSLQRQTVLVMDNASIHKSFEFQENIEQWQQQGLTIVNIAPYSPELNIIEIVWRKIKYEWMPFSAYESFRNLKESLFDILANIGKSYTVNFA